ncbi:GntR family transcriptional regulator [Streptomyces roseoverticillatus]|uniref:GntR family transcriptional regulator n=1 Tax=Streptomyces roseoverticillatus TaxID=66429 RepID=UPI001F212F0C|nr:GntR family transcriptional regulator [Streptomyces roseoverticillatus]MCF3102945.1 GntR family transcriptional regulator [Streptomyces roseoverticillatus]
MPQASPRGTYLQVAGALREQIEAGEIAERLPPKAELRRIHGVGASTIDRALAVLKAEGLIESVRGAANYVAGTGDRRPLVEKVTDLLRGGVVKPGDAFLTEGELCERFRASRTAVRSAIAKMEGQGLLAGAAPGKRREVRALPDDGHS